MKDTNKPERFPEVELSEYQQTGVLAYLTIRRVKQRQYSRTMLGVGCACGAFLLLRYIAQPLNHATEGTAWSSPLPGIANAIGAGAVFVSLLIAFVVVMSMERVLRKARQGLRNSGLPDDFIWTLDRINLAQMDRELARKGEEQAEVENGEAK